MIMADDGSRRDQVDMLIGNDYCNSLISNEKIELQNGLFLIDSDFGWILSGQCNFPLKIKDQLSVLTYHQTIIEK